MVVHDQYGYTNLSNSTLSDICYFSLIFLPLHWSPSDLKPGKHTQCHDPIVLMQVAGDWQVLTKHSLVSEEWEKHWWSTTCHDLSHSHTWKKEGLVLPNSTLLGPFVQQHATNQLLFSVFSYCFLHCIHSMHFHRIYVKQTLSLCVYFAPRCTGHCLSDIVIIADYSPPHITPFPVKPSVHVHENDPGVFVQVALSWQLSSRNTRPLTPVVKRNRKSAWRACYCLNWERIYSIVDSAVLPHTSKWKQHTHTYLKLAQWWYQGLIKLINPLSFHWNSKFCPSTCFHFSQQVLALLLW